MIPPFDIQGGLPLALARAVSVASLSAAAGSLAYARLLRPPDLPAALEYRLRKLCFASLAAASAGALIWLAAQTQDMAGAVQPSDLRAVLGGTLFGHLLAARLCLLALAACLLLRNLTAGAALAAGSALVLQAGHSHALAMGGPPLLLASAAIHIAAAGLWIGSLPALLTTIATAAPAIAHRAATRYSAAGIACVLLLALTAAIQFTKLVVNLPGLVGTAYGWMAGTKMLLFAALLALAARNRWRLTPALPTASPKNLNRAIALEIALGLAVFAAAGVLTELEPAMHTQKLWPFPWVPSLDAAREDHDISNETILAGVGVVLGLLLLAIAALARRRRFHAPAMALAGFGAAGASLPHLSPLLVPAVPTRFFHSPTGFTIASLVQGAALYPAHCAACHGTTGHGDGPLARTLPVPPADLTATHLWMHGDGELFWWLTHGIEAPRGGLAMPGFPTLSEDDRWSLIDFIRARNAGLTLSPAGWATPLQAPDLDLACPSGPTTLSALHGHIVTLDISTATLTNSTTKCRAEAPQLQAAYAIAAPNAVTVLIDANRWLRAASPGPPPDPARADPPLPPDRPTADMPADMKM